MLIGGTILIAAVAYLGISGVRAGSSYYTDVDTFMTDPNFQSGPVRLHGKVSEKDLVIAPSNQAASFLLDGNSHSLPVDYRGVLPDLFKAGCEVVVRGQKDDKGIFQAEQILTKCASKYAPEGSVARRPA
jgi:cytochrome c-type biogenesis protein CcmE